MSSRTMVLCVSSVTVTGSSVTVTGNDTENKAVEQNDNHGEKDGQSTKKMEVSNYSSFQLSVESNPELPWFCFTTLCDWSDNLAPPSQPIRCKTKTNRE